MSSYFDEASHTFRETTGLAPLVPPTGLSDDEFFARAVALETRIINDVSLVTGDKDFPEAWREKLQRLITKYALDYEAYIHRDDKRPWYNERKLPVNTKAREWLLTMRYSQLIEELHSAFHRVASERIPHRFGGWFSDNPNGFLHIREEALKESEEG